MNNLIKILLSFFNSILEFLKKYQTEEIETKPKPPSTIIRPRIRPEDIILANPNLFAGDREKWLKFLWFVVHHSLTKDGSTKNLDAIWKFHTSYRIDGYILTKKDFYLRKERGLGKSFTEPWKTIGYNVIEETVNNKHMIFPGRPLSMKGAHAKGFNHNSIGALATGNYDLKPFPDDEMELLAITIKKYLRVFDIPVRKVIGHRYTYILKNKKPIKTCPGKLFNMPKLRKTISGTNDRRLVGL